MSTVVIGDVETYFEEWGEGPPLVLLHGGMSDGTSWGMLTGLLAEHFHVWVPDRRGHGRTPDRPAPFRYESMAQETIAFCEQVVGEPAFLVGWSDGGVVALHVSASRPDLVKRQVVIGTNFHYSGLDQDSLGMGSGPDDPEVAMMKLLFEATAVDSGAHWPEFYAKTEALWRTGPTLTTSDLRAIATPTLVLVGDDEPIFLSHTIELYESLPNAQLCVVPGASHLVPLEQPETVGSHIVRALTMDLPPETLDPIRRGSPG